MLTMVYIELSLLIATAAPGAPKQKLRKPMEEAEALGGWSEVSLTGMQPHLSQPKSIAPHVARQYLQKTLCLQERGTSVGCWELLSCLWWQRGKRRFREE